MRFYDPGFELLDREFIAVGSPVDIAFGWGNSKTTVMRGEVTGVSAEASRLGGFEVEFVPGVQVEFFDLAVDVFDFDELVVLIDRQHAEGFVFLFVLVPLARHRCVFSAHGIQP